MSAPTASAIVWPKKYLPGTTDNFVSNETIAKDITSTQIWALLADITKWTSYYSNCSDITPPKSGPMLKKGDTFSFSTFGFPPLECTCEESVTPDAATGVVGRLAWSAAQDSDEDGRFEVYHAWLVEDLEGGRVRVLTQESQTGKAAVELAGKKPNPMLNGHQEWIDGLVRMAREGKA